MKNLSMLIYVVFALTGCASDQQIVVDGLCYSCLNDLNGKPLNYNPNEYKITNRGIEKINNIEKNNGVSVIDKEPTKSPVNYNLNTYDDCLVQLNSRDNLGGNYYYNGNYKSYKTLDKLTSEINKNKFKNINGEPIKLINETDRACYYVYGENHDTFDVVLLQNTKNGVNVEYSALMQTKNTIPSYVKKLIKMK